MKDILNVDGTFKRYYKNNNLKEKGKYINGEYEGEVINYLPDGHISQKRYFNKGIIMRIWSWCSGTARTSMAASCTSSR